MPIIQKLLANQTPEILSIDGNSADWQEWQATSWEEVENAFRKNHSTRQVILTGIPSGDCAQLVEILLHTEKSIHLQQLSNKALNKVYGVCDHLSREFQITFCRETAEAWKAKFADLQYSIKQAVLRVTPVSLESKRGVTSSGSQPVSVPDTVVPILGLEEASQLPEPEYKLPTFPSLSTGNELRKKQVSDIFAQAQELSERGFWWREHTSMGEEYFALKYIEESFTLYEQVIESNLPDLKAQALKAKGLDLFRLGRYPLAIDYLKKYLKLQPTDLEVSCELALVYASNNQFEHALGCLNIAEASHLKNPRINCMRGWVLAGSGNLFSAKREVDKVLSNVPLPHVGLDQFISEITDPDACYNFYAAAQIMSNIQGELKATSEASVYASMGEQFHKRYLALGGTLVSRANIDIPGPTLDKQDSTHPQPPLSSKDDLYFQARTHQRQGLFKKNPTDHDIRHASQWALPPKKRQAFIKEGLLKAAQDLGDEKRHGQSRKRLGRSGSFDA